jgi:hypothetical protein
MKRVVAFYYVARLAVDPYRCVARHSHTVQPTGEVIIVIRPVVLGRAVVKEHQVSW